MERGWRRQQPFEGRGAAPPWICGRVPLPRKGLRNSKEEDEQAGKGDIGTDRGHHVPASECAGVISNPARHACETQEEHWEEGEAGTDEHQPEMQLAYG